MSMILSHSMVHRQLKLREFSLFIYMDSGSRSYLLNKKEDK